MKHLSDHIDGNSRLTVILSGLDKGDAVVVQ